MQSLAQVAIPVASLVLRGLNMTDVHIDYSWVTPQLRDFVSGILGTGIIFLVILFVVGIIVAMAAKFSPNFYIAQGRWNLMPVCAVLAASLIMSLPAGMTWGIGNDPFTQSKNNIELTSSGGGNSHAKGRNVSRNAKNAQRHHKQASDSFSRAKKAIRKGDVTGAVKHGLDGLSDKVRELWDDGGSLADSIRERGPWDVFKEGWHTVWGHAGSLANRIRGR